jgi:hypothetical protein
MFRFTLAIALFFVMSMAVQAEDKDQTTEKSSVINVTNNNGRYGPHRDGYGWGGHGWGRGHSSTAAEGYMRGQGARAAGYAQYLRALGAYQKMHQEALRKHYENEDFRIKKYWETKREYEAEQRRRYDEKYGIKAEHARLDKVIEKAELEARKAAMREAGLLPEKQNQAFIYNGKDYGTYAKFIASDEYLRFLAAVKWKRAMDDAKARLDAEKQQEALRFLAERAAMSPLQRMQAEDRAKAIRQLRFVLGNTWVDYWIEGQSADREHLDALRGPLPEPLKSWEHPPE